VILAVFLVTWSLMKGSSPSAEEIASAQDGYALFTCTEWVADAATHQLFRMGFDGKDKHRLVPAFLCEGAWVAEAQALYGFLREGGEPGTERLVRASPHPENPIAEWSVVPVASAADLVSPRIIRGFPVVGPGGTFLFSAEDQSGNRDVYALETGSGVLRRLTRDPAEDWMASMDPAGHRVVFVSHRTGGGDLYSMNLDGSGLMRLTDDPLQDSRPWVRGDSVLFVRGRGMDNEDGNMDLFLLDLNRPGSETRLTENGWNDLLARWSPTGEHICWQSEKAGHFESEIEVMELSTRRTWNLSNSPGFDVVCLWTPDGQGVVYLGRPDGQNIELFLAPLHGGDPMNLTNNPGEEGMLGWFRLPEALRSR
jgi:Tol biopolymer transport system component